MSLESPIILFETDDFMVVYKPTGWKCTELPDPTGINAKKLRKFKHDHHAFYKACPLLHVYVAVLRPRLLTLPNLGMVHRYDEDTTGGIVFAKHKEAFADLVIQIHDILSWLKPGVSL